MFTRENLQTLVDAFKAYREKNNLDMYATLQLYDDGSGRITNLDTEFMDTEYCDFGASDNDENNLLLLLGLEQEM